MLEVVGVGNSRKGDGDSGSRLHGVLYYASLQISGDQHPSHHHRSPHTPAERHKPSTFGCHQSLMKFYTRVARLSITPCCEGFTLEIWRACTGIGTGTGRANIALELRVLLPSRQAHMKDAGLLGSGNQAWPTIKTFRMAICSRSTILRR